MDEESNETNTYSIMTTEPDKERRAIHDHMPVTLHREDELKWTDKETDNNPPLIESLLAPYEDDGLRMFEVSEEVNITKNNNEQLIYPINSK